MIDHLLHCCNERLSLGQSDIKELNDRLVGLGESERNSVCYHSECRKPIVNQTNIERLKAKRTRLTSPVSDVRGPGRPSSAVDSARPKRTKTTPKEEVCLFSTCTFCPKSDTSEPLHRVYSDQMGDNLLEIKVNTQDDHVRTCLADLEGNGDASALEKYYHKKCVRSAQRTFTPAHSSQNVQLIRNICDEQLLLSVQNTLDDGGTTLDMAEVNDTYL